MGKQPQIVLSLFDRSRGQRWAHIVSLLVSGILAVMVLMWSTNPVLAVFFGYFAMINFQVLQSIHQAQAMGLYQDDEWWSAARAGRYTQVSRTLLTWDLIDTLGLHAPSGSIS